MKYETGMNPETFQSILDVLNFLNVICFLSFLGDCDISNKGMYGWMLSRIFN